MQFFASGEVVITMLFHLASSIHFLVSNQLYLTVIFIHGLELYLLVTILFWNGTLFQFFVSLVPFNLRFFFLYFCICFLSFFEVDVFLEHTFLPSVSIFILDLLTSVLGHNEPLDLAFFIFNFSLEPSVLPIVKHHTRTVLDVHYGSLYHCGPVSWWLLILGCCHEHSCVFSVTSSIICCLFLFNIQWLRRWRSP